MVDKEPDAPKKGWTGDARLVSSTLLGVVGVITFFVLIFVSSIYLYHPVPIHCGAGSVVPLEGSSSALDSNPQTNKVYVTSSNTNRLTVINGDTCTVIKSLPLVGKNSLAVV